MIKIAYKWRDNKSFHAASEKCTCSQTTKSLYREHLSTIAIPDEFMNYSLAANCAFVSASKAIFANILL